MHIIENKLVRVSELSTFYLCPRLVYFERRREPRLTDAEVRAGVFKSVAYVLPAVKRSPDAGAELLKAIDEACSDCLLIYGAGFERPILQAADELRVQSNEILSGLLKETVSTSSAALTLYSERLRMSGTIDKVVDTGGIPAPVMISASKAPASGIYASDRIRLAAYAMLLSEKYNVDCREGGVEYVTGWCLRRASIRYEDKRKALYARNRILEMMEGRMPDAKKGKLCGRCEHFDDCGVKVSLLDSLFKNR
jgi:CRISPR-associated exonuclease Cas4